jgi:hypothetical protein
LTIVGAAIAGAGTNAQIITKPANTPSKRFMASPFFPNTTAGRFGGLSEEQPPAQANVQP